MTTWATFHLTTRQNNGPPALTRAARSDGNPRSAPLNADQACLEIIGPERGGATGHPLETLDAGRRPGANVLKDCLGRFRQVEVGVLLTQEAQQVALGVGAG